MAYTLSNGWAHGTVKMTVAKRAILNCHALAKEMDQDYDIALCHAIGQGCSTVHVETHALGLVFYELTAIVMKHKYRDYQVEVLDKINYYMDKLKWYQDHIEDFVSKQIWADFLIREGIPNKEKLLLEKTNKPMDEMPKVSRYSHGSTDKGDVAVKKLEGELLLYYYIDQEDADFGLEYDKWRDFYLEDKLKVSKYTVNRYINELVKTGRVTLKEDNVWGNTIHNKKFISLEEIVDYIKTQESKWSEKGSMSAESRRLLHLIRLIGWLDLFLQYGIISEAEINRVYSNKSAKRMVQRDFVFLRGIKSIPLDINRQKVISKENGMIQWFYVVDKNKRHKAEITL